MGKSRRNRSHAARRDPIAKPVKPPSDPELAALRDSKILPIIKDLQSSDTKSRASAASAIANVIQDAKCRKLLLREQIVHIVLNQTLTDTALESRAAGWGILQVLAQEEEADFCVHLYRLDILTAIEHAAQYVSSKVTSKDSEFAKLPKLEQSNILSIASSILSLTTALAEAQDHVLETICAKPIIIEFIFSLILATGDHLDGALREVALTSLMILSEDNKKLAENIISSKNRTVYETLQVLGKDVSGEGIIACSILHNIYVSLQDVEISTELNIADDSRIIPTLSQALAAVGSEKTEQNGAQISTEDQQLALEILASIGTSMNSSQGIEAEPQKGKKKSEKPPAQDDEEMDDVDAVADDEDIKDGDEEDGEEDEDDEMDEDEMQADMDIVTGADEDQDSESIDDLPVLKALLQKAIPQLVRVATLQSSDPDTMHLQGLSLSALNNIAWSLSLLDFSDDHNDSIYKAWEPVAKSIWSNAIVPILASDTADITLATQITGLAWPIARALRAQTPLSCDEHRKFISLYQATRGSSSIPKSSNNPNEEGEEEEDDPFQGLGVKCIGVLGQLALPPAPLPLNREIGTFLVTILSALPDQTPAADAVEALNQLFDIYGDEEQACDREVYWKDNFQKHLEEVLPKVKSVAKTVDKRTHSELRTRADEAVLNLTRFLAYKRKNKPSK